MNRFHIEDIVVQDKHGVIFRAFDEESGNIVSLRRFLPYGRDGGGLERDEVAAFAIAAERLSEISHVALRSVITGSADPIDGVPYLVTEWVEGTPLNEVLGGERLDPALVIDVLRIVLEVSIVISEAIGEEAVWVETEVESIIIGTQDSGRGFTFGISPFKWLGAQSDSRKLSAIVELGEKLAGWKGKAVGDRAGYGLGGWLKWLRKNPDVGLGEALQMLNSSIGIDAPAPRSDIVGWATKLQVPKKAAKSKREPAIIAAVIMALVCSTLFYLRKTSILPQFAANEITAPPSITAKRITIGVSSPAAAETIDEGETIFTQDDRLTLMEKKVGTPVKLRGTLRSVSPAARGNSIYLNFCEPADPAKVAGVVHRKTFKGEFLRETFLPYLDKELVITGTCFKEPTGRMLIKIVDKGSVRVAE